MGDSRYQRDDRLRAEYTQLVEQERSMLGGRGSSAREIDTLFGRIAEIEGILDRHDALIDQVVEERTADMRRVIE